MNLQCRICQGSCVSIFSARDTIRGNSGDQFQYVLCNNCRSILLDPIPNDLEAYYSQEYFALPETLDELMLQARPERYKISMVKSFIPIGSLLEIGPGSGGFSALAKGAGYDVTAIDVNARCVEFLNRVVGIEAIRAIDTLACVRTVGQFDVIAMWHVIEHIVDPMGFLNEIASHLRPGGVLVIATPNAGSLQFQLFGRHWAHLDAPRHTCLLPATVLADWGKRNELPAVLLTTRDEGSLYWNLYGWRESLAALVPPGTLRRIFGRIGHEISRIVSPMEGLEGRGAAYTIVLQRTPGRDRGLEAR